MNIGVIYDFGINKGGGDFVMLNILEALHSTGYNITLITSRWQGFHEAAKLFDKEADHFSAHNIKTPVFLRHPYTTVYIARKVVNENYDLLVLSDDVPKCLSNRKVVSYVHYLHAARLRFQEYLVWHHVGKSRGSVEWLIHRKLFSKFYWTRRVSDSWFFIANSAKTREHTSKALGISERKIALLHPPVASAFIYNLSRGHSVQKENLAVCLGRFEPDKRIEVLVNALSLLSDNSRIKTSLLGFMHDRTYLERLRKMIAGLGLESKVELILNAERKTVLETLLRAKVLVHLAPYEPFGIAVVEGMAAGCIPIVRKGANGPWTEITESGKYGLGFETVEELAFAIESMIDGYGDFDVDELTSRALRFDEKEFRDGFLRQFAAFLAEN